MTHWKEYKLEDLCLKITDGSHSSPKEVIDGTRIIATVKDMLEFDFNYANCKKITDDEYLKLLQNDCKPQENDILFSKDGTIGKIIVFNGKVDLVILSSIAIIRPNPQKVNPKYLGYYLKSAPAQKDIIDNYRSGSVIPRVILKDFKRFPVSIPDLPTQSAIAEILSSLDDKIELNNKINQELENLAQTLFKQWFIDFEFPDENGNPYKSSGGEMVDSELGEIPKGWEVKRLKEILTIKRGGSPRPIQDFIAKSGLPWVKISDATAIKSPFLFSTKEFIKPEGLKKTVLMKKGSLVLSNSATPGLPIFLELDACIHDGWLHFQDIKYLTYNFLYLFFLTIREDLIGQGNGSIFVNLKTDILKEYRTSIPNANLITKFENIVGPIFQSIKDNSKEIIELTNLRDIILPKLISGELEVAEVMSQKA